MSLIKPYKIDVPQSKLDGLRQKLSAAEFPNELSDAGWEMGSPLSNVQRLTKVWETFDWRKAEAKLNETPQFHTDINVDNYGTLDIHFVHQTSCVNSAIPLLFVHGCMPHVVSRQIRMSLLTVF